ncbi:MAG TPA: DUF2892 domain-containing protein [Cellulomonadaceae bacterium]|nr:DUF2892 domain-containing protein [Cellulomonadaceae bacterium]
MKQNMGTTDRILRSVVAAPVFVILGVVTGPAAPISWVFYALGAVMLGTGLVGFCPLYAPFAFSTRSRTAATASRQH